MYIGKLKQIVRHPVKSFRGESVSTTRVETYGLYGDRGHGFLLSAEPIRYLTATQVPEMIGFSAEYMGEESTDRFPQVRVTTPSGHVYSWEDERLRAEIERLAGRPVTRVSYTPLHIPTGAIEEEHLLITTDASIRKLEEWAGMPLDNRRFRSNLLIELAEDAPFAEDRWIGKRLRIGDVVIDVKRHCERCPIITIDPDDLNKTPTLLQTLIRERQNRFGVYSSVARPGQIGVGDLVFLED